MTNINSIKKILLSINPSIVVYKICFDEIVWEERVKLKCFHCDKYKLNWTCPPNIPAINYKEVIKEYNNMAAVVYRCKVDNLKDLSLVRQSSTNELHKSLLKVEEFFWQKDEVMALSFIGGSCKLCKNGCAKERCANPRLARIPVEALGINVIKSLENIGVVISFPIKDQLIRVGLLVW